MPPYSYTYQFLENEGLFCEDEFICDSNITVIDKKTLKSHSKEHEENWYLVEVTYTDGRSPTSKWIDNPRNIDYFKFFEINDSLLSAKARTMLSNKLLTEISKLPARNIIKVTSGINNIEGNPTYVMGENIVKINKDLDTAEHLQLETQQSMLPVTQMDIPALLDKAVKYITLFPGITELLFFFSLFAVVKPFVEQLQIHCGFLLALIAPSGQLKTTLARLYCLWLYPKDSQEIPIHSSMRTQHILDLMDSLSGQNVLIDDLRKDRNTNNRKRQESRLDSISRHIDSKFGCANAILTGETMENMGIFSCIDRILQVQMPILNAEEVLKLQKDVTALGENIMPGIALAFVKTLMTNYDNVLIDIQNFYNTNILVDSQNNNYSTRTHRHALFIRLTEFLFHKYFCNAANRNFMTFKKELDSALNIQIKKQEEKLMEIRFSESQHNYIADFYTITNSDKFVKCCTNRNDYSNSANAYLLVENRLYITSSVLKNSFFNYYGRYISPKIVVEQFHNEGILEEETAAKGFQKNYDGRKHYVINMTILVHYLVKHNYPVSENMQRRFLQISQPDHT